MARKQQILTIFILGALTTIGPFSIDMYLPGFPAIADDLATTISQVQLSLTSFFIGIAAGQLLYGPLLDRFGRKLPLAAGLSLYILASLGCALTSSIDGLISMRFLQAVGACAGMVAAQALVRDLFSATKTAQVFSLMTLVVAVSPMIAPTVGGYVTVAFGWNSIFIILASLVAVMLVCIFFVLPEGRKADESISLKPKAVLKNFYTVIRHPQFMLYALAGGIATAAPYAYIAGSSDVFINIYRVSEQEFGWIFATVAAVMIGATQFNHFLLRRFTSEQLVFSGLIYQTILSAVLVAGTLYGLYDKLTLIVLISLFLAGHGLTNPNANALSLAPFTKYTGSAASVLGCFRMAMGGITTALVSLFHNNTPLPMVGVMAFCVVTGLVIFLAGKNTVKAFNKRETNRAAMANS
jgi:MFS transporter, DHA1 family, multidrug resistance protein